MTSRPFRSVAVIVAAALLLGGCSVFSGMSSWFSGPSKSKLKGQRISIMATDESLKPDPTLKDTPVILPPP
ncbi:MAG: hypothetical protein KGI68_15810, partial [Alphaproteobacteria bacterium]|nr:hypothetical protein [Alphaproteobacteria bacterium]